MSIGYVYGLEDDFRFSFFDFTREKREEWRRDFGSESSVFGDVEHGVDFGSVRNMIAQI